MTTSRPAHLVEVSVAERWLLYGAYGFTGDLIARRAVAEGIRPVLAGRDAVRTRNLADALGLEARSASLEDGTALRQVLSDVAAVVHAAGPFVRTWRPMAEACLDTHTHYLDITGEIEALEGLHEMDARARRAGVALLPGVGFDVVPTDCLAARLAAALPGAERLELAFWSTGSPSRGTARSMVQSMASPPLERISGRIRPVTGGLAPASIPFSDGDRSGVPVSWGDVATAYHSTGIPDIRTYMVLPARLAPWYGRLVALRPLLSPRPVRDALERVVGALVRNPEPGRGESRVWGRVRTRSGHEASGELSVAEGYAFTAASVLASVRALVGGGSDGDDVGSPVGSSSSGAARASAGFLTPSTAFGAGFVDAIEGTRWIQKPSTRE